MSAGHTPGIVSMLPVHDGDGYSWGGDIIITFGDRSINLGTSQNYASVQEIRRLANVLAAAPELMEAAEIVLAGLNARIDAACQDGGASVPVFHGIALLSDAIAKATGQATSESSLGRVGE